MKPTLLIRKAIPKDESILWEIIQPIIRAGGTYVFAQESSKEKMIGYWINPDKYTYIAEWEGVIVGTFYIKANQPDLGDHICNAGFMVSKDYSRKGFGRALGEFALKEAKVLGFKAMQFNFVVETNSRAVRLWKNLGFEVIGKIPEAYRHPELGLVSALIMYRKL